MTKQTEINSTFESELQTLINQHSQENSSDTPDYILARYLVRCLEAYNFAVFQREKWYGRVPTVENGPETKGLTAPPST